LLVAAAVAGIALIVLLVVGGTCVQGLREELEAANAVVAKLHARIARVTSFVRFMVRTIPLPRMTTHFSGLHCSHCSGGCAWWW
jgi:hypothetical protein